MNRPPDCMTGAEYAGWKLADAECPHDPKKVPVSPCADCTSEYRTLMHAQGLCHPPFHTRKPLLVTA